MSSIVSKIISGAALLAGSAAVIPAFAAEAGLKGVKSSLSLSFTATSSIGNFSVKDADIEKNYAKGIEFFNVANPYGFDSEGKGSNYYLSKYTQKTKAYGPESWPTETIWEEVAKLHTEKFANAQFIQALADREYVAISDPKKWKLVAITPAEGLYQDDTIPPLFFIENGSSIHYVGRVLDDHYYSETGDNTLDITAHDALAVYFGSDVESYTYKSTSRFKHRKVDGEWAFDENPTHTTTDTFSGKVHTYVEVFPDVYYPDYLESPSSYYFTGTASFSGSFDAKKETYVTKSVSLPIGNSSGAFYGRVEDEKQVNRGITTGSITINNAKVIDDITPYLNAIPETLAPLRNRILATYATEIIAD